VKQCLQNAGGCPLDLKDNGEEHLSLELSPEMLPRSNAACSYWQFEVVVSLFALSKVNQSNFSDTGSSSGSLSFGLKIFTRLQDQNPRRLTRLPNLGGTARKFGWGPDGRNFPVCQ
jgi:hypothetical protein